MKSIFFEKKFYQRRRSNYSDVVEIENNIEKFRFYEIEKLMIKRFRKYRNTQMTQYLIRWINYDLEYDKWKNISTLNNNLNLIENYEIVHSKNRCHVNIWKNLLLSSTQLLSTSSHQHAKKINLRKKLKLKINCRYDWLFDMKLKLKCNYWTKLFDMINQRKRWFFLLLIVVIWLNMNISKNYDVLMGIKKIQLYFCPDFWAKLRKF